ncbi:hypothetical protein PENTCL1PPCAC_10781, partial [Pristionchus entomophagus]
MSTRRRTKKGENRWEVASGVLFKLGKSREADLDKNEEYLRRRRRRRKQEMEEDLRLHNSRTTPTSMRRATLYSSTHPYSIHHLTDPRPLTHTSLIDTRAIGTAGIPSLHPLSTTSSNNGPTSSSSSIITPRPLLQPRPL